MIHLTAHVTTVQQSSNSGAAPIYRYRACGLGILSVFAIPEFLGDQGAADVTIVEGALADAPALPLTLGKGVGGSLDDLYLRFASVGTFRIQHGSLVTVEPVPDADAASLRICLTGPVLGALLHQRRVLTLHASAVVINGGAVAFMAESGAGKSTTAAALHRAGCTLVADDITPLIPDFAGSWLVQPAIPRLKLSPDLAQELAIAPDALQPFHQADRRRQLRADADFATQPIPLRQIYLLAEGPEQRLELLSPAEAMLAVIRHSYGLRILGSVGSSDGAFRAAQRLANTTPIFRLIRPRRLDCLAETIRLLQSR